MRFLTLLVGAALISTAVADGMSNLTVETKWVDNCYNYKNVPNYLDEVTTRLDPFSKEAFISGPVVITKEVVAGETSVSMKILKCLSENSDSCGTFTKFGDDDFCDLIADKNQLWSPIIEKMNDFDPKCPILPGEYNVNDALVDMSVILNSGANIGLYRLQLQFMYQNEMQMCVEASGEVKRRRRVKKRPAKEPVPAKKISGGNRLEAGRH